MIPDDKRLEKAFEVAADNRNFEIDMFWKRTVVFWGFVAALFIGIATTAQKSPLMAFGLSVVSVVFSLIWTLANRRSKSWQESWEIRAQHYFNMVYGGELTGNIYQGVRNSGSQKNEMFSLRHGNYSLSKLLTALSDFSFVYFLGVAFYLYPFSSNADGIGSALQNCLRTNAALAFSIFGIAYIVYVVVFCRSKAQFIDQSELPSAHNKANPADAEKPRG